MHRGVSSGGGQSSLGYLFGSGEATKPAAEKPVEKPAPAPPVDKLKEIPAGIQGNAGNNYFRADGQNTGNFITVQSSLLLSALFSCPCAALCLSMLSRTFSFVPH